MFDYFRSKKQLIEKVEILRRENERLRVMAVGVENANFPKCMKLSCIKCIHAVICNNILYGCDKDIKCEDFEMNPLYSPDKAMMMRITDQEDD